MSKKNSANTLGTEMSNTEMLNNIFEKLEASDGTDLDVKEIERQLDILQERAPIELPDDIQEESLKELLEEHPELAKKENKGYGKKINARKILSIIGIAAALAIVLTVVAGAVGFGPVVKLVDDVAKVFNDPSGELEMQLVKEGEYHSLKEALISNDMDSALCITWIPKEYSLSSISVRKLDFFTRIVARYTSENGDISVVIKKYNDDGYAETVEIKPEFEPEVIAINNILFYISDNLESMSAWALEKDISYDIHGQITKECIIKIIHNMK